MRRNEKISWKYKFNEISFMIKQDKTIAVTGANGFVGVYLCDLLYTRNYELKRILRKGYTHKFRSDVIEIGNIEQNRGLYGIFKQVDSVVHLAARVHVMKDRTSDTLSKYREINTYGTENLAKAAAEQGVKRFVYISSIKVNGEVTNNNKFTPNDRTNPMDPYGVSKYEAEERLRTIAQETGLEVVIIRPPLVYGPGVKANFLRLIKWVDKGIPLPLASIHNSRSLVSVFNLTDFIIQCLEKPQAKNETFLISDDEDLSTPELIKKIALSLKVKDRLFPFPIPILNKVGAIFGKTAELNRLCGSLQLDIDKSKNLLEWTPPLSVDEGIQRTVDWYLKHRSN